MIRLVVLRHGPTAWNAQKKIQGRADIALSQAGREIVAGWRLSAEIMKYDCVSSPLVRAIETASIMGLEPSRTAPELIEMDWGDWEGRTLAGLRAERGHEMIENERRGLDFRPTGGESPRDVQCRLGGWLRRLDKPTVAICHKGVVRALYALACGWDMTGEPPQKLRDGTAHGFLVDSDGIPAVERINMPLGNTDE